MLKKWIKYIAIAIIFISIILFVAIHYIAPYGIVQPPKISEDLTPQKLNLTSEALEVQTDDNIILKGHWIKSETDTTLGLVILLHGIGGCKEHFLTLSKDLAYEGIESVLFDSRAHGESGGEFCTYGFKEKNDISKIVDHIKSQNPTIKIGIWGNSLGGAIAIQALEKDKRIEFGLIESTFRELDEIVYDYKNRILKGFGIRYMSDYALKRAGQVADFNPAEVKPIRSVKNIEQPIFMTHGDADISISVNYGKDLFNNLKSQDKELLIVEGGGHFDLFSKGGPEYKTKLFNFIKRQLGN